MRYHYNGKAYGVRRIYPRVFSAGHETDLGGFRNDEGFPTRKTRAEAQADLDAWAEEKGLEVAR
jgi:hypothetical protein